MKVALPIAITVLEKETIAMQYTATATTQARTMDELLALQYEYVNRVQRNHKKLSIIAHITPTNKLAEESSATIPDEMKSMKPRPKFFSPPSMYVDAINKDTIPAMRVRAAAK